VEESEEDSEDEEQKEIAQRVDRLPSEIKAKCVVYRLPDALELDKCAGV
jgi:hypothetical protein